MQLLFLAETFWLLQSRKVWIASQRRARSEAYPERPNSLIASKKQLSSHNTHSPSLDAPRRIISLEKPLSEELVQLLQQDKEEKCWRGLGGRRWCSVGVERRTVEYRASAERPLRKPRPLLDTVVAAPLEHCTLTTLCTDH